MITHITPGQIIVLAILFTALLVLVIGGLLAAAGKADAQIENFSGGTACEPGISRDALGGEPRGTKTESAETICSWCLEEQGIKPNPNDSHGVCQRHKKVLMADIERTKVLGKSQFA